MKYSNYYINYATLKRRGIGANIEYIYTIHKYPVRMPGYEDIDFLKSINNTVDIPSNDEVRFASSIARSRSKVLQLGANNKWDFFVTLTISPDASVDRYDFKSVVKSLLKFFDNYKQRRSSSFKYLVIPEKHKDGAYHFHGFFANINPLDLAVNEYGYLDFVPYCKKYGFCSLSEIKDITACASYVSKYISKDMFNGTVAESNTHLYYASRGLKTDEIIAVGSAAPTDIKTLDSSCIEINSAYVTRYYCKNDIFSNSIIPFENVAKAPALPDQNHIDYFKKKITYDFANKFDICINDNTDLLKLYQNIKSEILDHTIHEYNNLKRFYYELRHKYDTLNMSADEIAKVDELFELSHVVDSVSSTTDSSANNTSVYIDNSVQLDVWGDINEIE